MRPKPAILVLSGVLICMFSVAWSQNSQTQSNSNANRNANAVNRLPGKWSRGNSSNFNGGNWNGKWDPDTSTYSADPCRGPIANPNEFCANVAANAANAPWNAANVAANANAPRKASPRKKRTRRPTASLGGAFTFENSLSAMVAAGVS